MIDLETVDTAVTAKIIAIGACIFDGNQITSEFEVIIDRHQAVGTESESTLAWWNQQEDSVRDRMFSGSISTERALDQFVVWLSNQKYKYVWANPPTFDLMILYHAFKQVGAKVPWTFRIERDLRTLRWVGQTLGLDFDDLYDNRVAHDAKDDARVQALVVQRVLARIR